MFPFWKPDKKTNTLLVSVKARAYRWRSYDVVRSGIRAVLIGCWSVTNFRAPLLTNQRSYNNFSRDTSAVWIWKAFLAANSGGSIGRSLKWRMLTKLNNFFPAYAYYVYQLLNELNRCRALFNTDLNCSGHDYGFPQHRVVQCYSSCFTSAKRIL